MVQSLNIGKNALIVNQAALTVVGNNIANVNTDGYSKQRVNLASLHSTLASTNVMDQAKSGYGVQLESITRYRDSFVDSYYRDALSSKNYYDTISTNGSLMEDIANEFSGTGLSAYLNSFFSAANNLSLYPTDPTMKTNFTQEALNLSTELNNIATQLNNTRTNLVGDINNITTLECCTAKAYVDEINQILSDIANVNKNIIYQYNTSNGGTSSGLLDDRDALIDKLAAYLPVTVTDNTNGSANVYLGTLQLVGGGDVKGEFAIHTGDEDNPALVSFQDYDGYIYVDDVKDYLGQSGKLGAVLTLGGNSSSELSVKSMLDSLDKIANAMATEVNNLQTKGSSGKSPAYYDSQKDILVAATDPIFTTNDKTKVITALNITVNQDILDNPTHVATALVSLPSDNKEVGNNVVAQAFADLRTKNITQLNGLTFENFNTSITTDFGSKLSSANTNAETKSKVYEAANEKRNETIGVNLEEELMDLVKYQRAYEASAKVFSVADEILETLVNLAR